MRLFWVAGKFEPRPSTTAVEQGETEATLLFHWHASNESSAAPSQKQFISFEEILTGDSSGFSLSRGDPDESLIFAELELNGRRSAAEGLPVADEAGDRNRPAVLIRGG